MTEPAIIYRLLFYFSASACIISSLRQGFRREGFRSVVTDPLRAAMYQALLLIYLLLAVSIIVLVLLQQGKGAVLGAASAGGASTTLFGATGSNRFMCQLTAVLMGLFFALCLLLGNLTHSRITNSPWHDLSEPVVVPLEQPTPVMPEHEAVVQ